MKSKIHIRKLKLKSHERLSDLLNMFSFVKDFISKLKCKVGKDVPSYEKLHLKVNFVEKASSNQTT